MTDFPDTIRKGPTEKSTLNDVMKTLEWLQSAHESNPEEFHEQLVPTLKKWVSVPEREIRRKIFGYMNPEVRKNVFDSPRDWNFTNNFKKHVFRQGLSDTYWVIRKWSADELGKMGAEAKDSLSLLIEILDDPNGYVRRSTVTAISKIPVDTGLRTKTLVERFKQEEARGTHLSRTQKEINKAFYRIGEPVLPSVVKLLSSQPHDITPLLVRFDRKSLPYLADFLKGPNAGSKWGNGKSWALEVIRKIGESSPEILEGLVAVGADTSLINKLRKETFDVYHDLNSSDLSPLVDLLDHPEDKVKVWTIQTLGQFGPRSGEYFELIQGYTGDKNWKIRRSAVGALGKIVSEQKTSDIIGLLIDRMSDVHPEVRAAALQTFRNLPQRTFPSKSLTLLQARMADTDPRVRQQAIQLVQSEKVDSEHFRKAIVDNLTHSDPEIRRLSLEVLFALPRKDNELLNRVRDATRDRKMSVRKTAVRVLASFDEFEEEILNTLRVTLADSQIEVRAEALRTIKKRDVLSDQIISKFSILLASDQSQIKEQVLQLLEVIPVHCRFESSGHYLKIITESETLVTRPVMDRFVRWSENCEMKETPKKIMRLTSHNDPLIRKRIYDLKIYEDWKRDQLIELVVEGLQDSNPVVINSTLDFLKENPVLVENVKDRLRSLSTGSNWFKVRNQAKELLKDK